MGIMRILLTGSSGLIGTALQHRLTRDGHSVIPLKRSHQAGDRPSWDPANDRIDLANAGPLDAIIHLAGENIAAGRWTSRRKQRIYQSRARGTHGLARAVSTLPDPPKVMICASAVGFYGDRGDTLIDETQGPGSGFLAEVCQAWEQAAEPAHQAGLRVVHVRLGAVLTPTGGMLGKMLPAFRLGLGGMVGTGKQFVSWIALEDCVQAFLYLLAHDHLSGPVNVTSPQPVTNAEFTKTLGKCLHRPTILPLPAFACRLAFGELADALLLASTRVVPRKLLDAGFPFQYPDLQPALAHGLERKHRLTV